MSANAVPGRVSSSGKIIDARVCLVADDEALLGIEHRQTAAHVVERGFEAGVELLQLLIALQGFGELLLERVLAEGGFQRAAFLL